MLDASFVLYVSDLERSTAFYSRLLQQEPVPFEPTFVMFFLESGARLGLATRAVVDPSPPRPSSGFELDFAVADDADIDRLHAQWQAAGMVIEQAPHHLAFAYNFLALDPDGHRLRVYCRRLSA